MADFPILQEVIIDGVKYYYPYAQHLDENGKALKTGEVNNLPTKDTDVKTELELIKQEIADNKNTNDLILKRLDSSFDANVTGSIEEDVTTINKRGKGVGYATRGGEISASSEESVLSIPQGKSIKLVSLEFTSNTDSYFPTLLIEPYDTFGAQRSIRTARANGVASDRINSSRLSAAGGEGFIFKNVVFEENKVKISNTRTVIFPNGVDIKVSNLSLTDAYNIGLTIVYKELN